MKMKTCQKCGRRRPLKKLNLSNPTFFTELILCRKACTPERRAVQEEVEEIRGFMNMFIPLTEKNQKILSQLYPNKSVIFIDEIPPMVNPELAEALKLLLKAK